MWEIMVVGCNGITRKWMEALKDRKDARLTAFVDLVEERARALRDAYAPGAAVYGDMDQAFAQCKANLVLDGTPPFVHHSVVTRALREGRYVIGEKPMAESLEEA